MTCSETQDWLHAYVDNETTLEQNLGMERHLESCSACRERLQELQSLRLKLQTGATPFHAPEDLKEWVRQQSPNPAKAARPAFSWGQWSPAGGLALAGLLVGLIMPAPINPFRTGMMENEVIAAHVRALQANHLMDVVSSNQHTVKPWFNGKIDFAPTVRDFADEGFPLVGGRLDYVDRHPVAALVYRRQQHVINVFIWPETKKLASAFRESTVRGYHLIHWNRDGMTTWAISDLNAHELNDFMRLMSRG